MLFYTQIKKEFSPSNWKRGQVSFRKEQVQDVRLSGNLVSAKISDPEANGKGAYETVIAIGRGTISKAECNCSYGQLTAGSGGNHCFHIAALSIWVVERGSLLRAGVYDAPAPVKKEEIVEDENAPLPTKPVLFVRALFSGQAFTSLSFEAAVQFIDPKTEQEKTETFNRLQRQSKVGIWKSSEGHLLKLVHDFVPYLQNVETPPVNYIGAEAVEKLALVLTSEYKKQIVLHQALQEVKIEQDPLPLRSLHIGKRIDKNRIVSYKFANKKFVIESTELHELSKLGRLSANYFWKEKTIYRFATSLSILGQYSNRSGVNMLESDRKQLIPEGFARLEDHDQAPLHPLAAYRLSLELGAIEFTVDEDWKEFHEWKKQFDKVKIPKLPEVPLGYDLRDYQTNGLQWIWSLYNRGLAALLADDMGLGKTHQVMALLSCLYRRKKGSSLGSRVERPSLVIAPTSVVAAWKQKLEKYDTGLKWTIFHGKDRTLPETGIDLVLTTYGILQKESPLRERDWHIVILDEAQAVKNPSTISSRASRILKCQFRIALTGTPVENQAMDLWSIMEFLLPGYLGGLPRFKRLYGHGRDIPTQEQAKTLRRLVSPFLLRRTKSQVLKELPEKTEEMVPCEMTVPQKKAYRSFLKSSEAEKVRNNLRTDERIDYASILALLTRLKQVCDHPRLPELKENARLLKRVDPMDTGKWEAFEEIMHEALGSSLKVVVFTQYLGMLDVIGNWLTAQGVGFVELRGDTRDRGSLLEIFSKDPECKVFLCSLLAGGLGIDLTSASVCIHFDRWWNPAKENQATDRLHRIGQTRGVQVFKLFCPGTVEDRIASIIESKTELSGALIEESPLGLKAFSRQELLELLGDKLDD